MALFHIKRPGKSGHLDNLDTFCRSQGVHNTQVPLYVLLHRKTQTFDGRNFNKFHKYLVTSLVPFLDAFSMSPPIQTMYLYISQNQ